MAIYLVPCTAPGPKRTNGNCFSKDRFERVALKIDFGKVKRNKWSIFTKQNNDTGCNVVADLCT